MYHSFVGEAVIGTRHFFSNLHMIDSIFAAIRPQLIILTIVYLLVLFVIFLDLWAGIRKARHRGEYRSSYGYRKTVEKIAKYFNLIFVVTAIDAVQMLTVWQINEQTSSRLPLLPILTVLGAMFIGFIELKSIYEKSEDKEKAKIADAAAALGSAMRNRETQSILVSLLEYMQQGGRQPEVSLPPVKHEHDRSFLPQQDRDNQTEE